MWCIRIGDKRWSISSHACRVWQALKIAAIKAETFELPSASKAFSFNSPASGVAQLVLFICEYKKII